MDAIRSFYLPEDFVIACDLFHIEPTELLLCFIENITIYEVFNAHSSLEEPKSSAAIFCQNYFLHLQATRPKPTISTEKKALHLKHIAPILLSIQKALKPDAVAYTQIVSNWYNALNTHNSVS